MSTGLAAGMTATRRIDVDPARTIDFMGDDCRVYATPELVRDIEMTCRDLIKEHVGADQDSVGTRVEIDHTAATLLGMWVEISVRVEEVKGRAVRFAVDCRDAQESCAKGFHHRFVVDVATTAQRLRDKAAKARA